MCTAKTYLTSHHRVMSLVVVVMAFVAVGFVNSGSLGEDEHESNCQGWLINGMEMHWAACSGSLRTARRLIEHGFDLGAHRGEGEMHPLEVAAEMGHVHVVEYFLVAKDLIGPNVITSAIDIAQQKAHVEIAYLLAIASVGVVNEEDGQTVLHVAAASGSFKVVNLLLDKATDLVPRVDGSGQTVLHVAASYGRIDIVGLLLRKAAVLVSEVDYEGQTVLHLAVMYGYVEVVDRLLSEAAELVSEVDDNRKTILHLAAKFGHVEIVTLLLRKAAYLVPEVDLKKRTVLHLAVKYGHVQIVKLLIDSGVNVFARTAQDQTALILAIESKAVELGVIHHLVNAVGNRINDMDSLGHTTTFWAMKRYLEHHDENSAAILNLLLGHGGLYFDDENNTIRKLQTAYEQQQQQQQRANEDAEFLHEWLE